MMNSVNLNRDSILFISSICKTICLHQELSQWWYHCMTELKSYCSSLSFIIARSWCILHPLSLCQPGHLLSYRSGSSTRIMLNFMSEMSLVSWPQWLLHVHFFSEDVPWSDYDNYYFTVPLYPLCSSLLEDWSISPSKWN